jgi:hypothetical protein
MQNTMTIDYETVVYNYGAIDGNNPDNIVTGFGSEENYDRRRSPIAIPNSNAKILGSGGLVDSVGGTLEAIGSENILGAIKTAGSAYYTFKDRDLKQTAKQELLNGVSSALTNPNFTRNITNWIPLVGSTPSTTSTASAPQPGAIAFAEVNTAAGIARTSIPNAGGQVNKSGATSYPANLSNPISTSPFS